MGNINPRGSFNLAVCVKIGDFGAIFEEHDLSKLGILCMVTMDMRIQN